MTTRTERPRQFRMTLSDVEWDHLTFIASVAQTSCAGVLRAFIERRYNEVEVRKNGDLYWTADVLSRLAAHVKALAEAAVEDVRSEQKRRWSEITQKARAVSPSRSR